MIKDVAASGKKTEAAFSGRNFTWNLQEKDHRIYNHAIVCLHKGEEGGFI